MELINFNANLYILYRKIKETRLVPDKINELKEIWSCEAALRNNGFIYFCRLIPDAELVEESVE